LFLKAVGQPLGTAERVKENRWEMHRGYWKDSGQFLKDIGQLPGMPEYPTSANRKGGRVAQWLLAKTWQFQFTSSEVLHFCF
jgi:hypothetical protein